MFKNKDNRGVTFVELLIVIAIITILSAILYVAIDPLDRLRDARNSKRWQDVTAIANAVKIHQLNNKGQLPTGLDASWRMLGTASSGCNIACGSVVAYSDYTYANFSLGTNSNIQWDDSNNWLELTSAGQTSGSGVYTSGIKDASDSVSWTSLSWVPEHPYYKELPNNGLLESGYNTGNVNMSGNVLLYHMNESTGSITDYSGQGNNGTMFGASYGAIGKYNTAIDFDGINDYISVPTNIISPSNNFSASVWIKTNIIGWQAVYDLQTKQSASQGSFLRIRNNGTLRAFIGASITNADAQSNSPLVAGRWYHVAVTYDGTTIRLYLDGVLQNDTGIMTIPIVYNTSANVSIGRLITSSYFNGVIDELAFYNRSLSSSEVLSHYLRGANRLKFQVRSCDDNACSGESFIGSDGTNSTYYTELGNSSTGLPSMSLTNLSANQYFQYQASFETDNAVYSPNLKSIGLSNDGAGGGISLQNSCLDLSSVLQNEIIKIPADPLVGNSATTYYAIRRNVNGQINVTACSAEKEQLIQSNK